MFHSNSGFSISECFLQLTFYTTYLRGHIVWYTFCIALWLSDYIQGTSKANYTAGKLCYKHTPSCIVITSLLRIEFLYPHSCWLAGHLDIYQWCFLVHCRLRTGKCQNRIRNYHLYNTILISSIFNYWFYYRSIANNTKVGWPPLVLCVNLKSALASGHQTDDKT